MELQQIIDIASVLGSAAGGWLVAVILWFAFVKSQAKLEQHLHDARQEANQRANQLLTELTHATRPTITEADRAMLIERARRRTEELPTAPGD
jgi:hypothetical protein